MLQQHFVDFYLIQNHKSILYNHRLLKYFLVLNLYDILKPYADTLIHIIYHKLCFYIKFLLDICLTLIVFSDPYHIFQLLNKHLLFLLMEETLKLIYSSMGDLLFLEFRFLLAIWFLFAHLQKFFQIV